MNPDYRSARDPEGMDLQASLADIFATLNRLEYLSQNLMMPASREMLLAEIGTAKSKVKNLMATAGNGT